jgi:molybdopterin synthase sulfur carrier subunit
MNDQTSSESFPVQVLFFGLMSDYVSKSRMIISLKDSISCAELYQHIAREEQQLPDYEKEIPSLAVKVAVNQTLSDWDQMIGPNDEVAFLPPVTGG